MSSTNRGGNRHASDYYITPASDIKDFLSAWLSDLSDSDHWIAARPDKAAWLDPCAGGDADHPCAYASIIEKEFDPLCLSTIDIREDSRADIKGDFLAMPDDAVDGNDIIITNPPFSDALPIIEKALRVVNDGGFVIMLLRLNFLGSQGRQEFFSKHMPTDIFVHPKRISFTDNGVTDSIEYAHFVWQKGKNPKLSKLRFV